MQYCLSHITVGIARSVIRLRSPGSLSCIWKQRIRLLHESLEKALQRPFPVLALLLVVRHQPHPDAGAVLSGITHEARWGNRRGWIQADLPEARHHGAPRIPNRVVRIQHEADSPVAARPHQSLYVVEDARLAVLYLLDQRKPRGPLPLAIVNTVSDEQVQDCMQVIAALHAQAGSLLRHAHRTSMF